MMAQGSTRRNKSKKLKNSIPVRVHVPKQLNEEIERYRATQRSKGTVIGSKEKAILHLTELGLTISK